MPREQGNRGRPVGTFGEAKQAELTKAEEKLPMYKGITLGEAVIAFRMDPRTIKKRAAGLKPSGERQGRSTYYIHELAPHLVAPVGDFAEFVRNASPRDLPPLLTKEYWNGVRARQAALENEGQLWKTERIVGKFAEAFKTLRTSLLLIPDQLERKTTLSEAQSAALREGMDEALEKLRVDLVAEFAGEGDVGPGSEPDEPGIPDDFFDVPEEDEYRGL